MLNDEYENFVTGHMEAAATECMPTKSRAKCRVPWESQVVRENKLSYNKIKATNERNY